VKTSGTINVGGIIYWLTEDMVASWQHAVMTFDLNEESFARIELPAALPDDCVGGGPRRYWIREIDGKACIATAQTYPSQPRRLVDKLQIWTLDNKAEQRWSQTYILRTRQITYQVQTWLMGIRSYCNIVMVTYIPMSFSGRT
jgi:hypothetical protein